MKAQEACLKFGAKLIGDGSLEITGVADPRSAIEGSACFVINPAYLHAVKESRAKFWVMTEDFYKQVQPDVVQEKVFAITTEPYLFFTRLAGYFFPEPTAKAGIHPQAFVHPEAKVHSSAQIDAFVSVEKGAIVEEGAILSSGCHVGENARIGAHSHLYSGVKIYHHCVVGERNILHSGVVIGADGFGFIKKEGKNVKIPQVGRVVLKNDVEIGANTTVDRGAFGDTVIGEGVKLDDQVMIGHNSIIGDHSLICAQAGISGNTTIGKNVLLSGKAATKGHLKIGDNVSVGGQSGVTKDIPAGLNVKGYPAQPLNEYLRNHALYLKLPELYKKVLKLEKLFEKKDQI